MNTAIIALGSNLGNSIHILHQARAHIQAEPAIASLKISSLYQTAPMGHTDQPDFINAVALIETTLTAPQLLTILHNIEQQFGRKRSFQNAPRTLDLDIIDFNHEILNTPTLTLPHPRAHQRSFVMTPLAEIAPDYCIGTQTTSAKQWAKQLGTDGIHKLHTI